MLLGTELHPHVTKSDGLSSDLRASLFWESHRGRRWWPTFIVWLHGQKTRSQTRGPFPCLGYLVCYDGPRTVEFAFQMPISFLETSLPFILVMCSLSQPGFQPRLSMRNQNGMLKGRGCPQCQRLWLQLSHILADDHNPPWTGPSFLSGDGGAGESFFFLNFSMSQLRRCNSGPLCPVGITCVHCGGSIPGPFTCKARALLLRGENHSIAGMLYM